MSLKTWKKRTQSLIDEVWESKTPPPEFNKARAIALAPHKAYRLESLQLLEDMKEVVELEGFPGTLVNQQAFQGLPPDGFDFGRIHRTATREVLALPQFSRWMAKIAFRSDEIHMVCIAIHTLIADQTRIWVVSDEQCVASLSHAWPLRFGDWRARGVQKVIDLIAEKQQPSSILIDIAMRYFEYAELIARTDSIEAAKHGCTLPLGVADPFIQQHPGTMTEMPIEYMKTYLTILSRLRPIIIRAICRASIEGCVMGDVDDSIES